MASFDELDLWIEVVNFHERGTGAPTDSGDDDRVTARRKPHEDRGVIVINSVVALPTTRSAGVR
jgi:hypothetical protein